jgi:phospholipid-binding lipoprotein MlaA
MGLVSACASAPNADARDPLEPFNRDVQRFNDGVDRAVVKPIATVYREVTPSFVRTLVGNFFGNLSDIWSTLNTALQLRPEDTAVNALRLGVNTFFGFGGLIDIASEMNLYRSPADFGQTLGTWGVPPGPYLVLPLLGPSTVRDTLGRGVESRGDRVMGVDHIPSRNSLYALRLVEARANLLRASDVLDEAALDKYTFTREVFLSRRQNAIDQQRRRDEP